jgi:hypothetical protein
LIETSGVFRAERRFKFRYPLDLMVRFRPLTGPFCYGAARSVNLSSGGVLIVPEPEVAPQVVSPDQIRMGAPLEMSIEWPTLLDGKVPLQLFATGRVVRYRPYNFAVLFERYQFRTMSKPSLSEPSLPSAGARSISSRSTSLQNPTPA